MKFKQLEVVTGNDGNVYFFESCEMQYRDWKRIRGAKIETTEVVWKVSPDEKSTKQFSVLALFNFWYGRKLHGSIRSYRLDFVYSEEQSNGRSRKRYFEEDNSGLSASRNGSDELD